MTAPAPKSTSPTGGGMLFFCGLLIAAVAVGLVVTAKTELQSASETIRIRAVVPDTVKPVHPSNSPGLHNVFRLGETLYSGSEPEEDAGFNSLTRLGIKTIISVDGAEPDVAAARVRGMRYVHLPIKYTTVPAETLLGMFRASKVLEGPIYVHCHHGKHRGPAAAVSLWRCLDRYVTNDQAVAALHLIGTADRYQGLYASVRDIHVPTEADLAAPADLPESTPVAPLTRTMSDIDRMWDRVAAPAVQRNTTTLSHQLTTAYDIAELFREAARTDTATEQMQPEIQRIVDDLENLADIIKTELRNPSAISTGREDAVTRVKNRCLECHTRYRD